MTTLWLAVFECSDRCLSETSSGGVKAMLDVGYDRPAAQTHAPEDDILQPSISGRDSIPEDRHVPCIKMPCIKVPCVKMPCIKVPCIKRFFCCRCYGNLYCLKCQHFSRTLHR